MDFACGGEIRDGDFGRADEDDGPVGGMEGVDVV